MIQLFCVVRFLYFKIFILFNFDSIITMSQDSASILTDIDIQIEATSAINKMYNFEFDDAEKEFKWLVQEYKNHPLPVFLLGLSKWWKIDSYSGLPKIKITDELKLLDKEFLSLMDKSIFLSKKVYENVNNIDGAFFLAASYGFKGRLLSERRKWRAAAFAGMNALKYLKEIRKDDIMIPEISFGNGLFNYYSIWISDRYPLLKPIVGLFPEGDKKLGIDQLNNAANNFDVSNTHSLGQILYTDYIHVFQISGMILLVAMIGAIVLTFRTREGVKKQSYLKQISRERSEGVELLEVETNKGVKIDD